MAYAIAIAADELGLHVSSRVSIAITAICWVLAVALQLRRSRSMQTRRPIRLLFVAAIFFGLSAGALLLPLNLVPRPLLLIGLGFDVFLLGLAIARLDAFDAGETLWRDLLRSFIGAALAAGVFGGLMGLAVGSNLLLYLTLAAAIGTQTFGDALQTFIDKLAFVQQPALQHSRAELRDVAAALPRIPERFNPHAVDEAEFIKLTRRALSHLGDLAKLSTSPLTRLPAVEQHLARTGATGTVIERAAALQHVLTRCIVHLKPSSENFGTSDAWRHYNALYFPYVVGLKPYALRTTHNHLAPEAQAALEWFQHVVPERTLHNWQTAAAKLVAQQLRESIHAP
jgi:hypothetical protein